MSETLRLREDEVVWQDVDDDLVVLDLRSSTYFKVNGTGALLWDLLREPTTRQDLVAALVSRYGIDEGRAASDVDAFIQSLNQRKLLDQ